MTAVSSEAKKAYEAAGYPTAKRRADVARVFDLAHRETSRAMSALRRGDCIDASRYARQAGLMLDAGERVLRGDQPPAPTAAEDGVATEEARTSALVVGICLGAGGLAVLAGGIFAIVRGLP
ncbi:MAG TPA: hypothetical protein VM182_10320 [Terriglobia bacterium]|nr:hypothetical protein [Terriglobia bacterium]